MFETTNWDFYDKDYLKLAVSHSETVISELLTSFRQVTERSYWLFAFLVGIFSYAGSIILKPDYKIAGGVHYIILLVGILIAIIVIFRNLFSSIIAFTGTEPKNMISEYYEQFQPDEQERKFHIQKLIGNQLSIDNNEKLLSCRSRNLKTTFRILVVTLIVTIFTAIICQGPL